MKAYYKKQIKFNSLEINKIFVGGIFHPKADIHGELLSPVDYSFEIYEDGKNIDFHLEENATRCFDLTVSLNKKIKHLKIYLIINNHKHLIHDNDCTTDIRIIRKIMLLKEKVLLNFNNTLKYFSNISKIINKSYKIIKTHPRILLSPNLMGIYYKKAKMDFELRKTQIIYDPGIKKEYHQWIEVTECFASFTEFNYKPLISIIIPVYNTNPEFLTNCLDSALNQIYDNFEICIADDKSDNQDTINILKKYEKDYKKIKVVYRKENGNVSEATNSAISIARGKYIALLDHDDILHKNALYEMVKVLNEDKTIDMIYTDEDKIDLNGIRHSPFFKPDWSPDLLLSNNYICHFVLLKKALLKEIGYFNKDFDGSQDYDMFLRYTEKAKNIHHIAKILYHWRMIDTSLSSNPKTRGTCIERGRNAIDAALKRRKIAAEVIHGMHHGYYIVKYKYKEEPKISIIIPTRDYAKLLKKCIDTLYKKTKYSNYEVIIVDNGSKEKKTKLLLQKLQSEYNNLKVLRLNTDFNYSYLNNEAVKIATGDYILLLNNDTEIIQEDWLSTMVSYAMQKHVGAVGIKLLYSNRTVQHCGVVFDRRGVAKHIHYNSFINDFGVNGSLGVPRNYSVVTGACLMISKEKYWEVDGLEEDLKVAFNDVDFCIKILNAGYYNVVLPQVIMYHHESKSRGLDTTSEKQKRFIGETEYMNEKWGKILYYDRFYNKNFSTHSFYRLEKKIGINDV